MQRSKEFLQGYNACAAGITRTRNPYLTKPGSLQSDQSLDWTEGWNTRFYGESIYEGHPDP